MSLIAACRTSNWLCTACRGRSWHRSFWSSWWVIYSSSPVKKLLLQEPFSRVGSWQATISGLERSSGVFCYEPVANDSKSRPCQASVTKASCQDPHTDSELMRWYRWLSDIPTQEDQWSSCQDRHDRITGDYCQSVIRFILQYGGRHYERDVREGHSGSLDAITEDKTQGRRTYGPHTGPHIRLKRL